MALSASCAGHTSTQSHASLYKIINDVVVVYGGVRLQTCGSEVSVKRWMTLGTYARSALTFAQTSLSIYFMTS